MTKAFILAEDHDMYIRYTLKRKLSPLQYPMLHDPTQFRGYKVDQVPPVLVVSPGGGWTPEASAHALYRYCERTSETELIEVVA